MFTDLLLHVNVVESSTPSLSTTRRHRSKLTVASTAKLSALIKLFTCLSLSKFSKKKFVSVSEVSLLLTTLIAFILINE